jgi:serine/threonine protein kinase
MSRVLQQDIEGKTMNVIGPIRWMSPESLGQQVYSKKSDIWSFGIVSKLLIIFLFFLFYLLKLIVTLF